MDSSANAEIIYLYFIGSFGMIIMAGVVSFFFFSFQKKLLKKELELNRWKSLQQEEILRTTIHCQENEQKRIARDLHDEVGVMLSLIKLNLSLIERNAGNQQSENLARMTREYIDETILQVRKIAKALMPPAIERDGLAVAIEELTHWLEKTNVVTIRYWQSQKTFRMDSKLELTVFRIVQELINNTLKHANASTIDVKVRYSNHRLSVSVCDDGCGFEPDKVEHAGLGLRNIESRVQLLKGRLKIKSAPGKGTAAIFAMKCNE